MKPRKPEGAIWRSEIDQHPGHVFVKRGNVALTRALLARGAIRVVARRGGRIEQTGVAALPQAIEAAQAHVHATEGERAQKREQGRVYRAAKEREYREEFAQAVRALYPGIPDVDLEAVVGRACEVSSGRVGRCAAAKALARDPIRLAVLAHIRHAHTDYEARLRRAGLNQRFGRASSDDRKKARKAVKNKIAAVAARWATVAAPETASASDTASETTSASASASETASASVSVVAPSPSLFTPPPTRPRFEQRLLWERPLG